MLSFGFVCRSDIRLNATNLVIYFCVLSCLCSVMNVLACADLWMNGIMRFIVPFSKNMLSIDFDRFASLGRTSQVPCGP